VPSNSSSLPFGMKIFVAAVLLLALLSSTNAIRFAQLDDLGNEIQRVLTIVQSPTNGFANVFEVVSQLQNLGQVTQDNGAIQFLFSTAWAPRQVLTYFTGDTNSADIFNARWVLWKLVEYQNVDNLLEFDPTIDNVVSQFSLFSRSWSPLTLTQSVVDGAQYYTLCTQLNDTLPRPDVKICASVSTSRILSLRADPNAIQFTFHVANYQFQASNSKLALKTSFNSGSLVQDLISSIGGLGGTELNNATESALEIASTAANSATRVLASWSKIIDVTGTGCSAIGSVVRSPLFVGQVLRELDVLPLLDPDTLLDPVQKITYFSFLTNCQPTNITWDPEFGVATTSSSQATSGVSVVIPSFFLLTIFTLLQLFF